MIAGLFPVTPPSGTEQTFSSYGPANPKGLYVNVLTSKVDSNSLRILGMRGHERKLKQMP